MSAVYFLMFCPVSILAVYASLNRDTYSSIRPISLYLIAFISMIACFQYGLGDYFNYKGVYETYSFKYFSIPFFLEPLHGGTGLEFIFSSISSLFSLVGLPYTSFFVFITLLSVTLKLMSLKHVSLNFFVSVWLYLGLMFFKDITQLRGNVAATFLFFAFFFLYQRKTLKFYLLVFVASGFHILALLALPMRLVRSSSFKAGYMLMAIVGAYCVFAVGGLFEILLLLPPSWLGPIYWRIDSFVKVTSDTGLNPFGGGAIVYLFIILFGYLRLERLKSVGGFNYFNFYIFTYGFILFVLFSSWPLLAHRSLEMILNFSLCLIIPMFMALGSGLNKLFWLLFALAYSTWVLASKVSIMPPYEFLLLRHIHL